MKVTYNVNDRTRIDVELKDVKQVFSFLSYADSVFGMKRCGNCESNNLSFCHRQPQGYDYYSVKCLDCGYELKFGQQKEGGRLFPKGWEEPYRSDESGEDRSCRQHPRKDGGDGENAGTAAGNRNNHDDEIPF